MYFPCVVTQKYFYYLYYGFSKLIFFVQETNSAFQPIGVRTSRYVININESSFPCSCALLICHPISSRTARHVVNINETLLHHSRICKHEVSAHHTLTHTHTGDFHPSACFLHLFCFRSEERNQAHLTFRFVIENYKLSRLLTDYLLLFLECFPRVAGNKSHFRMYLWGLA